MSLISMSFNKECWDLGMYGILLASTIFSSKYVLSILNFMYPTIFQGWQTLIGGILLKLMMSWKYVSVSTLLDNSGFISLVPSFLFFAAGLVASSKALAELSIPVFLCLHNTFYAAVYLLNAFSSFANTSLSLPIITSLLTICFAITAVLFHIEMTFADSPYFWMLVFVSCLIVQNLHSKVTDARYNANDKLYYSYVFSVIILAPASLYLEEAFEVMKFPNASQYDFYAGCLLSGVLGLFLNLHTNKVRHHNCFPLVDGVSKGVMCIIYALTYSDDSSILVKASVAANLVFASFIPALPQETESEPHSESRKSLLDEVE